VLRGFRARFLQPRDKDWFSEGLLIASGCPETVRQALASLGDAFPRVKWDLLSRREYPEFSFRSSFIIRRPLGGFRLLWSARQHFEIVVLIGARSDRELSAYRWAALFLMAPRRFFIFMEGGDGFWLSIDDAAALRNYYPRIAWFVEGIRPGPRSFLSRILAAVRKSAAAKRRFLVNTASALMRGIVRFGRLVL
jgi:hypothetical protein